MVLLMFFFFKQKTAYELRISDWSSDVCSSDLPSEAFLGIGIHAHLAGQRGRIFGPAFVEGVDEGLAAQRVERLILVLRSQMEMMAGDKLVIVERADMIQRAFRQVRGVEKIEPPFLARRRRPITADGQRIGEGVGERGGAAKRAGAAV